MSFFRDPLGAIWVYALRGFISHHVGEPAYCWWSTDTDVSVDAWACTKHSVHGRTELYRTNWTVAHGVLFHRRQGLLLDYSGMKEPLPDSSLSHLDYESRIYDNGLCGTSMSGICYIIAEQY